MRKCYVGLACDECVAVICNGGEHERPENAEYYRAMLAGNRTMHTSADYVTADEVGFVWRNCATCDALAGNRTQVYLLYAEEIATNDTSN